MQEHTLRQADRIDPNVKHESGDYTPQAPTTPTSPGTSAGPDESEGPAHRA